MSTDDQIGVSHPPQHLLETHHLADALESNHFKRFLDHIPFAVIVSELKPPEHITYANVELERLIEVPAAEAEGATWDILRHCVSTKPNGQRLSTAVVHESDYLGTFTVDGQTAPVFDAWSNIIEGDNGAPVFRLVAMAFAPGDRDADELAERLEQKDTLLRELQHRVKNNLQMITALIRMEARNTSAASSRDRFDRLAGRIAALSILYSALSSQEADESVDLGVYLSQIASAVVQAHASEGIRLNLQVDTWPVSINVAMPTGLVVNELLTNSLKHAFVGRAGGTITLHSLVDESGCRVIISDDGIGLPEGVTWPQSGKLGMLIAQSLRSNARATLHVESAPQRGVRVTIFFAREDAAPASAS